MVLAILADAHGPKLAAGRPLPLLWPLEPLPSIFLLCPLADVYSSRYFQFIPAFWILRVRLRPHLYSSPVGLVIYTHGQVLVYSASCIV